MMEEQDDSRRISSVVDRISGLPDCILGDILSFLPTKEAVATSLLSKRWKSAWVDVHNLHFEFLDPVLIPDSAKNIAFIRFVHSVLLLIGAKPLNTFRLVWISGVILLHVIRWIDAAIVRNVRHLTLNLGDDDDFFILPITGFNCDSLQSLETDSITFVYDDNTTAVRLPRLETLILDQARFTSEEAFEKLINGCPMLHYLRIIVSKDEEDFMYVVSSPSLTHLDMYIEDRCRLELNAPSLEYLELKGRISEIFVHKSLTSPVDADFPQKVVCAHEHLKCLSITATVVQALGPATASLSTMFTRLVKLVIRTDCCCCLQDFVLNFENLEKLQIYQAVWRRPDTSDVPHNHSRWAAPHNHSRWAAPVVVPSCLSKTLKKVRLTGYKGLEVEREMIRYMLEHGIVLEVMQIACKNKEDGEKLLREICEFPRKSPACKVCRLTGW